MKRIKNYIIIGVISIICFGCQTTQQTNVTPNETEIYNTYTNIIIFPKPELD